MATTGWKSPGTQANVARSGSHGSWTSPGHAAAYDQSYTSVNLGTNGWYSDWLELTNYGFTDADIPSGATINGIEAQVSRESSVDNAFFDSAVYLLKAGSQAGSNGATATYWPTSEGDEIHGDAANLWGTTWTDTDIKSANFGIDLSCVRAGSAEDYGYVDVIQIRVTYTAAASFTGSDTIHNYDALGLKTIFTMADVVHAKDALLDVVKLFVADVVKLYDALATFLGFIVSVADVVHVKDALGTWLANTYADAVHAKDALGLWLSVAAVDAVKLYDSWKSKLYQTFAEIVHLADAWKGRAIVIKVVADIIHLKDCVVRWRWLQAIRNLGKARCPGAPVRTQPRIDDGLSG